MSDDLIGKVAEAIRLASECAPLEPEDWADEAAAAVAAVHAHYADLGGVSDGEIDETARLFSPEPHVRALIARAVATAVAPLEAELVAANDLAASNMYRAQRAEAEVERLRAEVERLREVAGNPQGGAALGITWPIDRLAPDGIAWHDHYKAEVERRGAAVRDRDAYAAEQVRAALIDAAEAIEADVDNREPRDGAPERSEVWFALGLTAAARIVRDRAATYTTDKEGDEG